MQSLLFAFVCGATYPNVIRAALFIASMVATFSAAALHMRRPYRFAWVPFAVIASVELLALYCYQFRLFKPGNEWYSGARASIEYWGFNRADAEYNPGAWPCISAHSLHAHRVAPRTHRVPVYVSVRVAPLASDGTVTRLAVTTWSFVGIVGVQLGVLLFAFLHRWSHDLRQLVTRVERVRALARDRVQATMSPRAMACRPCVGCCVLLLRSLTHRLCPGASQA